MEPAEQWHRLKQAHPLAAQAALVTCLPVRVSPAFLRLARLRLRLLSGSGTGDEADLWLSDLVETRSAAGFSYRRPVRDFLRGELSRDAALLEAVWHQVHLEHAPWLAPRARLEEELTWRLLRDRTDGAIETHWHGVVEELDGGVNAEGVARWVVRAVPDLPEGTLDHESGRWAFYGAHLLLGDASVLGTEAQRFLDTGAFAFATRRLPRRRVFVGLPEAGGLLVSSLRPIENGHGIEVPATRPLWLQLEEGGESSPAEQVITIEGTEPVHVETRGETVVLRSIDGAAYRLAPQRPDQPPAASAHREPRVEIEYDVELYGSVKKVQLPFVMGVMADLSGQSAEPLPPVEERKFLEFDSDNFDARMERIRPRVAFQVPSAQSEDSYLAVDLSFASLEDFSPDAITRSVGPLGQWLRERDQLQDVIRWMEGRAPATSAIADLLAAGQSLLEEFAGRTSTATGKTAYFRAQIEGEMESRSEDARLEVHRAIDTLAGLAASQPTLIGKQPVATVQAFIADLERKLNAQLNSILHEPRLQRLEGVWRGLRYLVDHTATDELLKIRVMNIAKPALAEALQRYAGDDWDQSPLFKKIYEEEFGQFGGQPYGCLVGDYAFDHSPPDVALLAAMARIGGAAHCPFIAAAAPTLLQMSSWRELVNPRDFSKLFATPDYAAWQSLRNSEDARHIGLTLPRFLARRPYRKTGLPLDAFDFDEEIGSESTYVWANSAYLMAANIARAFKTYQWCARIAGVESGGAVIGLPTHALPVDDGTIDSNSPTEIAIGNRGESQLARMGLMPLAHFKDSGATAFVGAQSLQNAREYDDPDATANARLAGQWALLLPCWHFVHYIKCIVRDKVGFFATAEAMRDFLQRWMAQYVDRDHETSTETAKIRRPFIHAEIAIDEVDSEHGYCDAKIYLRPQFQLRGLTVALRFVTRLPIDRAT